MGRGCALRKGQNAMHGVCGISFVRSFSFSWPELKKQPTRFGDEATSKRKISLRLYIFWPDMSWFVFWTCFMPSKRNSGKDCARRSHWQESTWYLCPEHRILPDPKALLNDHCQCCKLSATSVVVLSMMGQPLLCVGTTFTNPFGLESRNQSKLDYSRTSFGTVQLPHLVCR